MWEFEKYQRLLNKKEPPGRQLDMEAAAALASLEQEKEETLHKLELSHEKLVRQNWVLCRMIAELEERSQRPVHWMLQNLKSASPADPVLLPSHKLLFHSPVQLLSSLDIISLCLGKLHPRVWHPSGPSLRKSAYLREGPRGRARTWAPALTLFYQDQVLEPAAARTSLLGAVLGLREILKTNAADIRLDPDTACSHLIVSKDRKCMHYGLTEQKLPDNPERFYLYYVVLGSQCISSGRYYWEVEVEDKYQRLGVCKENVAHKKYVYFSLEHGFWVIRLGKVPEYHADIDEHPLLSLPVPPRWVGVFLDYEAHDISFYNVTDNGSHIFTFPRSPFPGRLLPYISPCYSIDSDAAPLTICSLDGED
ncbi:LOW QUALITY PROTEIN: E3 ubiquitin-protein ligase TRIM68-like [Erethizon dorsatum]